MSRPKNELVVAVEKALARIFEALGAEPDFIATNQARKNTSRPYRQIRVESQILFELYHDRFYKKTIGDIIKLSVPSVISTKPIQYTPSNKVLECNNVTLDGLMIHIPL